MKKHLKTALLYGLLPYLIAWAIWQGWRIEVGSFSLYQQPMKRFFEKPKPVVDAIKEQNEEFRLDWELAQVNRLIDEHRKHPPYGPIFHDGKYHYQDLRWWSGELVRLLMERDSLYRLKHPNWKPLAYRMPISYLC